MGLAEKRIQQEFNDTEIPKNLKYYSGEAGGAMDHLQVEIDWASLGDDKVAYDGLKATWLQPLQGIAAVCKDDAVGQGGVKEGLKKVVIKNVTTPSRVECKDGVLTAYMNLKEGNNGSLGYSAYKEAVENGI